MRVEESIVSGFIPSLLYDLQGREGRQSGRKKRKRRGRRGGGGYTVKVKNVGSALFPLTSIMINFYLN